MRFGFESESESVVGEKMDTKLMTINFLDLIKAQITQSLIKTLFERAGYLVTRLGVEELFTEIIYLDKSRYEALNLPQQLRFLPDLLVAEPDLSKAFLLEVKFRRALDKAALKSVHSELRLQRQHWPDAYAVLLIADSFVPDGRFHQDYIRVVPPNQTEALDLDGSHMSYEGIWDQLPMLTHFKRFNRRDADLKINLKNADLITTAIRQLKRL